MISQKRKSSPAKSRSLHAQLRLMTVIAAVTLLGTLILTSTISMINTEKMVENLTQDMLTTIARQVQSVIDDIDRTCFGLTTNIRIQEFIHTENSAKRYIDLLPELAALTDSLMLSRKDIYDVLLTDADNRIVYSLQAAHSAEIHRACDLSGIHDMKNQTYGLPMVTYGTSNYLPFVRKIYGTSIQTGIMHYIGCCIVIIQTNTLNDLVSDLSITKDSEMLIADQYGRIIASNIPENVGQSSASLEDRGTEGVPASLNIDRKRCLLQQAYSGPYTIMSVIPFASLMRSGWVTFLIGGGLALLAAVIYCLISHSISRQIAESVSSLQHFLEKVTSENSHERLTLNGPRELVSISEDINSMLDQLSESQSSMLKAQSDLYETQLMNRKTQFMALQRQINPHFLYNTLGCMAGIGAARQVPEITRMATSMSKIFRYCIKGNDMVSIAEETECVQHYLEIIDIRYHGKIHGTISVEPDAEDCMIPKMILQPLVENAVIHGLEPCNGQGQIRIHISLNGDTMVCTVEDDGQGMSPQEVEKMKAILQRHRDASSSDSIGIRNISERLWLRYGDAASIQFESKLSSGTTVCLQIPTE